MSDMTRLKMETKDMVADNVQKIAALFPNCVTEKETVDGKLEKGINWKMLKQMLKGKVIDGEEAYEFTWVGKKAAVVEANKPIRKTLRPCKEESKNWDTTENLYIEGDNLEALKLLQESYLGKVKMIYIDPPYNTGHDFVYPDSFKMGEEEYNEGTKYFAEDGTINFSRENSKQAGKYHSDWCSMMYSRLMLARHLLTEDGVIFISADDNEIENLREMCNEVFGEGNFIVNAIWISGRTAASHFTNSHEYVLGFAKNLQVLPFFQYTGEGSVISDRTIKKPGPKNPLSEIEFPAGIDFECEDKIFPKNFGDKEPVEIVEGIMECKNCKLQNPIKVKAAWAMKDMIESWISGEDVVDSKGQKIIRFYFKANGVLQYEKAKGTVHPNSVITGITTKSGTNSISELIGAEAFSFPKPPDLIEYFSKMVSGKDIVLDFFSGSATTAHAVMQLNAEDGGHRKFIMVQLPEPTDKKSEAYKAGYKNICEIGKERIRRAGDKIVADNADKEGIADLDIGFRVLKVDSSNMNDVYYGAEDYSQELLLQLEDNIKSDRSDLDLLFGCIVDWGLKLSCPYSSTEIEGYTVHNYNDGDLIACFAKDIPESVIKAIAKMEPMRAVFRDSGFADSPAKINVTEIFKRLAPDTEIRVL